MKRGRFSELVAGGAIVAAGLAAAGPARGQSSAAGGPGGAAGPAAEPAPAPPSETPSYLPTGGIYGVDSRLFGDAESAEIAVTEAATDVHTVKKGDTLWDICKTYFRDPWQWPRVWALNPHITNPHWIFEGDLVRLREAEAPAALPVAAQPAASVEDVPVITVVGRRPPEEKAVLLRRMGLIEAADLAMAGRIDGSREEKIMLAAGDSAYVRFPQKQPLKAGERYTVFTVRRDTPIVSPETGQIVGYIVDLYGDIVVDQVGDQMARGTLTDLDQPVERGYYVSPVIRQFSRIEPRPATVTMDVRILAAIGRNLMQAPEQFVILGRGKRDGVVVGNRAFVVRRGDGYARKLDDFLAVDARYPREVVGELWVVDVREASSVAWIARATKEISVGEITEMRKGY